MRIVALASLASLALVSVACQMPQYAPPPAAPSGDPTSTTAAPVGASPSSPSSGSSFSAPSTPSAPSAPKAPTASTASIPTTVEIHSDCSKTVPVFYGDKPKFGSGTKSSVSSNSTSSQGRKSDGTLTIWIIDEQENGLASVKVTPDTKRVTIDSSCKSISAR
jgi:hypothetical protein